MSFKDRSIIEASCCHKGMTTDSPHLRDLLTKLPSLTALDLSHNKMTAIPNLALSPQIRALNLSHNEVADKTLFSPLYRPRLRTLVELRLRNNQIGSLKGFAAAPNLLYLDLSFNKINSLKGLENIAQMKTLQLANNEISGGLRAFTFMKALVDLSLANNPVARKGGLYQAAIANYCPTLSRFDGRDLARGTKALKRGDAGVHRSGTSPEEGSPNETTISSMLGAPPGTLSRIRL